MGLGEYGGTGNYYFEIMDREGNLVADYPGAPAIFDHYDTAFTYWTWTPAGDLLVVIDSARTENLDEGAVLALIEQDDLLAGDGESTATVLQTFEGGDEQPGYLGVSKAGDQIAYTYLNGHELYVMPFEVGGEGHRVARIASPRLEWPTFSPDGTRIVVHERVGQMGGHTYVIPNHGDDTIVLEPDSQYELQVPTVEGGPPADARTHAPYAWDRQR